MDYLEIFDSIISIKSRDYNAPGTVYLLNLLPCYPYRDIPYRGVQKCIRILFALSLNELNRNPHLRLNEY